MNDAQLESNDLYICRECNDQLFISLTALNNHLRKNHTQIRLLNNLQLVEQFLFKDLTNQYESHWVDGLDFLSTLQLEPPKFRQPLTTKIRYRLEQHLVDTFLDVVELNSEGLKSPDKESLFRKKDYDPWPLLQLQILFEQLVLFPITDTFLRTVVFTSSLVSPSVMINST